MKTVQTDILIIGAGVLYRQSYLNSTFFVAGSETAAQHPGYMDGAVRSAYYVYEAINAKV
ncbi:MAG: FAD-dependent oxidoreductase [Saprospiraceae bacterium]